MAGTNDSITPSSFRDPSGFVFQKDGIFYRQVNKLYRDNYDLLYSSGLFKLLVKDGLLINHKETGSPATDGNAYKIIEPDQLRFISYPYEWCFSQLKDAALLTLRIQLAAIEHGMSLKDASAYNIQFVSGRPILIDTLSFEKYNSDKPWVAYRQFCQHFLAPLALQSLVDLRFGTLSQQYLDGIPLDLTAKLLPAKSKFSIGLASHIHLHARSLKKYSDTSASTNKRNFHLNKNRLLGIIKSLESTINSLQLPKQATEWGDYYDNTNYSSAGFKHKEEVISRWIKDLAPKSTWDAGANDGSFSRLSAKNKIFTIATDIDPLAIEYGYRKMKEDREEFLLPLILDFTNPSPAIGWSNHERGSFLERSSFDLTLCLAFIHHLAISNNLPFAKIAKLFSQHTKYLIIEFVPKEDSNTQRLLSCRDDIFSNYTESEFENKFLELFKIKEKISVNESKRTLYLMQKK